MTYRETCPNDLGDARAIRRHVPIPSPANRDPKQLADTLARTYIRSNARSTVHMFGRTRVRPYICSVERLFDYSRVTYSRVTLRAGKGGPGVSGPGVFDRRGDRRGT